MYPRPQGTLVHLPPSFKIKVSTPPKYPPIDEEKAELIFEKLSKEKPLFNGTLLCIDSSDMSALSAYPLSFKEYIASSFLKEYPKKHIPLAVSGWVLHQDALLFGIRSESVLFYPGYLELVPSGGVDAKAIDPCGEVLYKEALIQEFEEETGLLRDQIDHVQVKALHLCPEKNIFDICLSISLISNLTQDIEGNIEEYSHLFWIPLNELSSFIRKNHQKVLPLSKLLIEQLILKPNV